MDKSMQRFKKDTNNITKRCITARGIHEKVPLGHPERAIFAYTRHIRRGVHISKYAPADVTL
jgi:hypothetical protein